ncbi:hypothetical protein BHYA_0249g00170 [Botrytis hyacinthi]|uniref:Uncharacterized protein n=1 Tax=Botrytis hyacinthi TaxID=278943 RepID=A0A4Z1GHJ7_9HELO|nr:hypothetical protein BHYA_0249g00170 [Botrytis hyacinthi]
MAPLKSLRIPHPQHGNLSFQRDMFSVIFLHYNDSKIWAPNVSKLPILFKPHSQSSTEIPKPSVKIPSYENYSNQVPQALVRQMTRGQCEKEEARILSHIERLEGASTKDPKSGLIVDKNANKVLAERVEELQNQIKALKKRITTVDEWDRSVFGQNAGNGSTSRNRSSQSPSGSRAPNTSTHR